jgi:nitrile hydratase
MWLDRAVDGIHDLGGMQGFGPVEVERGEPVFHEPWERRVFAMTAMATLQGVVGNTSRFRHAVERMDPAAYLATPYYEHWLTALATLLGEAGVIEPERLRGQLLARPAMPDALDVPPAAGQEPRFAAGDAVRVRDIHPAGHTRCPRYVRGRVGTVERVDPPAPLPDVEAHSERAPAEAVYGVRFLAGELWGARAEPEVAVSVDLWESYLEPAA